MNFSVTSHSHINISFYEADMQTPNVCSKPQFLNVTVCSALDCFATQQQTAQQTKKP